MNLFKTLGDILRPEQKSLLLIKKRKSKKPKGYVSYDYEARKEAKLIKKYEK